MVNKKDYEEAKEIIKKYEEQLKNDDGKRCFILTSKGSEVFVTLDEEWAKRVYADGQHMMIESKIVNP
jgi:hypothetical protein